MSKGALSSCVNRPDAGSYLRSDLSSCTSHPPFLRTTFPTTTRAQTSAARPRNSCPAGPTAGWKGNNARHIISRRPKTPWATVAPGLAHTALLIPKQRHCRAATPQTSMPKRAAHIKRVGRSAATNVRPALESVRIRVHTEAKANDVMVRNLYWH